MEDIPPELLAHFIDRDGFCYPEWPAIIEKINEAALPGEYQTLLWRELVLTWLQPLLPKFGPNYQLHETNSFFLAADSMDPKLPDCREFLAFAIPQLQQWLPGAGGAIIQDKSLILLFNDAETFRRYVTPYFKGEEPPEHAVFLSGNGYEHIALCHDSRNIKSTLADLLVIKTLSSLPLPQWLSSALVDELSESLFRSGYRNFQISLEDRDEHLAFWAASTIQQFWSGTEANLPEGATALRNQLARVLLNKIRKQVHPSPAHLRAFILSAHRNDAGAAAATQHLGVSPGDLVADFLGEGDWEPHPSQWPQLSDA